jgi:hypothetical protein
LIRPTGKPTGNDWVKAGEELRDGLLKRKKPSKKPGILDEFVLLLKNLLIAPFEPPTGLEEKEEKKEENRLLAMTSGEREIIEGIEKKIAKLGFESIIRFIFVDDREHFTRAYVSAVIGAFHQFNTHNLNAFRPNKSITVINTGFFKDRRTYLRKRRIYDSYFRRRIPRKAPILNIEELATIYHFPSIAVKSPGLQPVATRKGEPPVALPIE